LIKKVRNLLPNEIYTNVYIGMTRTRDGRYFIWRNKERVDTGYNGWMPREPNNAGRNENCGTILINRHTNAEGWNDLACHHKLFAICESGRVKQ